MYVIIRHEANSATVAVTLIERVYRKSIMSLKRINAEKISMYMSSGIMSIKKW
jgi:hypothetical protein